MLLLDHNQPRNAPSREVHSFLSRDGAPPAELRLVAREQLRPYTTLSLLLTTGVYDELPALPGLAERWGTQVLHCPYCHGWEVRERRLAVLANAPWATQYALTIRGWSDDVTLLTDGPATLADEERQRLLRHKVAVDERPLAALTDGTEGLLRVQFADGGAADYAALFYRSPQRQSSDLAQQLGCAIHAPMPGVELIRVDAMGQTTVPGVYAAGDATNMTQQAIIAASEGLVAAGAINRALLAEDFA